MTPLSQLEKANLHRRRAAQLGFFTVKLSGYRAAIFYVVA